MSNENDYKDLYTILETANIFPKFFIDLLINLSKGTINLEKMYKELIEKFKILKDSKGNDLNDSVKRHILYLVYTKMLKDYINQYNLTTERDLFINYLKGLNKASTVSAVSVASAASASNDDSKHNQSSAVMVKPSNNQSSDVDTVVLDHFFSDSIFSHEKSISSAILPNKHFSDKCIIYKDAEEAKKSVEDLLHEHKDYDKHHVNYKLLYDIAYTICRTLSDQSHDFQSIEFRPIILAIATKSWSIIEDLISSANIDGKLKKHYTEFATVWYAQLLALIHHGKTINNEACKEYIEDLGNAFIEFGTSVLKNPYFKAYPKTLEQCKKNSYDIKDPIQMEALHEILTDNGVKYAYYESLFGKIPALGLLNTTNTKLPKWNKLMIKFGLKPITTICEIPGGCANAGSGCTKGQKIIASACRNLLNGIPLPMIGGFATVEFIKDKEGKKGDITVRNKDNTKSITFRGVLSVNNIAKLLGFPKQRGKQEDDGAEPKTNTLTFI